MPLPGISARIVGGEIQLRGPNVFAGYWRREEATRDAFDGEWFKSGDMAECSNDGYYTLLGRKTDLIISGGFNIYPREIEDFLLEQDEVAEAVVVGAAHKLRGEIPVPMSCCAVPLFLRSWRLAAGRNWHHSRFLGIS
jgi:acyl-CoA synthetase (AMP-forming)/AMP-acid ligase II